MMEKKMETTIVYWGNIGIWKGKWKLHSILGLGLRALELRVYVLGLL